MIEDINDAGKDKIEVVTDKRTITIDKKKFIAEFLPVETSNSKGMTVYKGFEQDKETMNSISAVIMKNIQLIDADEKNIPKAKAINDQVKTLISLQSVKIKTVLAMRK